MISNCNHGWVWPRDDGRQLNCGGPKLCPHCAKDQAAKNGSKRLLGSYTGPLSVSARLRDADGNEAAILLIGQARDVGEVDRTCRVRIEMHLDEAEDLLRSLQVLTADLRGQA